MKKKLLFQLLLYNLLLSDIFAVSVSKMEVNKIADKIWNNECGGTIEGLTSWNKGEEFASMGIGHFVWYPPGKTPKFQETFPALIKFLKREGAPVPLWLERATGCPWNSREEFNKNMKSPKMVLMRQFLSDTTRLQAIFIVQQMEKSLPLITEKLSQEEQNTISHTFHKLSEDPRGLYALIDYVNFKGLGISPTEVYKGQGWGLLQVLQSMPSDSETIVEDFVASAKKQLLQRVKNSPSEKQEEKWLKGWINRINTYLESP